MAGYRRSRWSRPRTANAIPGAFLPDEKKFQSKVASYAKTKGLLHYHTHDSQRSEGGFPDSVIVGNYVMFRELKSDSKSASVSQEQRKWIERLEAAGADVGVWWPAHWESGQAQAEMDDCARRRHADGGLVLPDIAKYLYLFTDLRPAAGLLWDSGKTSIDRITWRENADSLMRTIGHSLPTSDEEILAWLERHNLGAGAGAGAFFAALRGDFISAARNREAK
jgi:hypothetical protein